MWQLLSFWPSLGPVGRAVTLFCLGLAVGSFLSVLRHRLPLRQDPLRGRSHCPTCDQTLGLAEMVPVLSYLMQRGRCRHCQAVIAPLYPLLELSTGALAAAGGLVSWTVGLAVLGALVGTTWVQGRSRAQAARGLLLVEVLVAFLLLAISIGAVLDLFGIVLHAGRAGDHKTEAVALARAQYSLLAQGLTATSKQAKVYCNQERTPPEAPLTGEDVLGLPELAIYRVAISYDEASSDNNQCLGLTITVTCPDCPYRYGEQPLAPVMVRGYIRKRLKQTGV